VIRARLLPVALALLLLPSFASAKESQTWSFRGQVPGDWIVSGMTAAATPNGVRLSATQQGTFAHENDAPFPIETVSLTLTSPQATEAIFVWQESGTDNFVQFPFLIPGQATEQRLDLNLAPFPQWEPRTERLGLVFRPGANILLQGIEVTRWGFFDKLASTWNSFLTFEQFTAYSINFLWGPLLGFNPIWVEQLLGNQPPIARSANGYFYALLAIAAAFVVVAARLRQLSRRRALSAFLVFCLAAWVVYDLRMGLEIFRYALTDHETYITTQPGQRQFRNWLTFTELSDATKELTRGKERFAFLTDYNSPFMIAMRYQTYPVLPMDESVGMSGIDTWAVFERSGAAVLPDGRLAINGAPVSPPGRVVRQFGERSFIFQATP